MDNRQFFIYLMILAGSTYLIRAVPFSLIKRKIKNRFVNSFLHYIPYAVLTVMTIPGIFYAPDYVMSAVVGFMVAILFAFWEKSLTVVAVAACTAVFFAECIIKIAG